MGALVLLVWGIAKSSQEKTLVSAPTLDTNAIYLHGQLVWAELTAKSEKFFNGDTPLVNERWYTPEDIQTILNCKTTTQNVLQHNPFHHAGNAYRAEAGSVVEWVQWAPSLSKTTCIYGSNPYLNTVFGTTNARGVPLALSAKAGSKFNDCSVRNKHPVCRAFTSSIPTDVAENQPPLINVDAERQGGYPRQNLHVDFL